MLSIWPPMGECGLVVSILIVAHYDHSKRRVLWHYADLAQNKCIVTIVDKLSYLYAG